MHLLKDHFLKNGKYQIISRIGQGGFGITYKAHCFTEVSGPMGIIKAQIPVAIKEFFISDYCNRNEGESRITISSATGNEFFIKLKNKFFKEATIISKLKHNNIVSVFDIFEENNTVYMVMPYIEGSSLKELIAQKHIIDENTVLKYASQLCDAVAEIHRNNILHLDIKPSNILIENDGTLKLIDFGISKQYDNNHNETSTTPVGRSKGFAPPEQYAGMQQFSPVTDIYAMGATLYNMLTGVIPVESINLFEEDITPIQEYNPSASPHIVNAINLAMNPRRNKRPQSVNEFRSLLSAKQPNTISVEQNAAGHNPNTEDKTLLSHTNISLENPLYNLDSIYNDSSTCQYDEKESPRASSQSSHLPNDDSTIVAPKSALKASSTQQPTSDKTITASNTPQPTQFQSSTNAVPPQFGDQYNEDNFEDEDDYNLKWCEYGSKFEKFLRYTIFTSFALFFIAFLAFIYRSEYYGLGETFAWLSLWSCLYSSICIPIYLLCINFNLKEHSFFKVSSLIYLGLSISDFLNLGYFDFGYCSFFDWIIYYRTFSPGSLMLITPFILFPIIIFSLYVNWTKNIENKKTLLRTIISIVTFFLFWFFSDFIGYSIYY